jgi:hypothetical protein
MTANDWTTQHTRDAALIEHLREQVRDLQDQLAAAVTRAEAAEALVPAQRRSYGTGERL